MPEQSFLDNILLFARMLRRAGLPVSLDRTLGFAAALVWIDMGSREEVFHTARATLVSRREDLELFEILFRAFWRAPARAVRGDRQARRRQAPKRQDEPHLAIASYMAARAKDSDPEMDVVDRAKTWSPEEALQNKPFDEMTEEELAEVRRVIESSRWQAAMRRTRRLVAGRRGRHINLRRALRDSGRYGGTLLQLGRLEKKVKPRPVILLADISGSMEKYTRLVLQLFYALSHSLADVETFVFGTRLSRITSQLRIRNIDRALESAGRQVLDWAGGTRIGESLEAFNRDWGRRVLGRGAVVVIISDGWERGDSALLGREMRHLGHRCHRLIWLNPHAGSRGYEPLVEGMAMALPFVDDFLPVHNLQSLGAIAEHLARLPATRSARRSEGNLLYSSSAKPLEETGSREDHR